MLRTCYSSSIGSLGLQNLSRLMGDIILFYGLSGSQIWDFNLGQSRNPEEPSPVETKGSTFTFNEVTHVKNDTRATNVKAFKETYQVSSKLTVIRFGIRHRFIYITYPNLAERK